MQHVKTDQIADADLSMFQSQWSAALGRMAVPVEVIGTLIGLTRLGEHAVEIDRLASVLGKSTTEAETLARRYGWPGVQVEGGSISLHPERAAVAARRRIRIGEREFGLSGCAPDLFIYAAVLGPSLVVEENCSVTGKAIRVEFTPEGPVCVEPPNTVVALLDPQMINTSLWQQERGIDRIDAQVCLQQPFFASADAARGWLTNHPGGRVFPVKEAWHLSFFEESRDALRKLVSRDVGHSEETHLGQRR